MVEKTSVTGKNKEEMIETYLKENNLTKNDIYVIEIPTPTKLFSNKKVTIDIVKKNDIINFIKDFLKTTTSLMGLETNVEVRNNDEIYNVLLLSSNNPVLIGQRGKNLNALQSLLRQAIRRQFRLKLKINVDIANYKEKKNKNLEIQIKRIAKEIIKTKVDVKLDPMTSFERRIVHNVIATYANLETKSIGEEPNRYVVISYKGD